MVFCNICVTLDNSIFKNSHNPYFSRWFSAIELKNIRKNSYISVTILILVDGFLQFMTEQYSINTCICHNPYFSRWFSAIMNTPLFEIVVFKSQSLF